MLQGFATARGAKRTGRTEPFAPTDGTSYPKGICSAALHCRTPSPTARSAVIVRSEATRQSVLPLLPSAREVAARSADGGRAVILFYSPPVGCADSPLPEGALQRGGAAPMAAGRCGHRPLRNDLQGGTHVSRRKRHILSGGARGPRPTGCAGLGRTESSAPTGGASHPCTRLFPRQIT